MKHIMKLLSLEILGMFTLGVILACIVYIIYMTTYQFDVLTLNKDPMPVDVETVKAGEHIHVDIDFTKNYNFNASDITYNLVNGVIYELSDKAVARPVGDNEYVKEIDIPLDIHSGTYVLQIEAHYIVSPLREPIVEILRSEPFTVTDGITH